jgi:THO complex subunit 2
MASRNPVSYKQTRFNLLREQSEGYSKLTTEIFSMLGPQQSTLTALPAESMADVRKRARLTWNKIVSLIGYFDLDPNRALDIILDLFSSHVQANHVFFLELIRCSPWTRAPKMDTVGAVEVNQRSESRMDTDPANGSDEAMDEDHPPPSVGRAMNGMYAGKSFDDVLRIAELGADLPDPPASDEPCILGQILGFKFAYYQVSTFTTYHCLIELSTKRVISSIRMFQPARPRTCISLLRYSFAKDSLDYQISTLTCVVPLSSCLLLH